jgi:CheY-like chemotaxis protein
MDLAAALMDLAFDVVGPAATLEAATELLGSAVPDGVLLDINLRGETSYALARACIARGIWFAFVTAMRADSIPQDLRALPRLAKPWTRGRVGGRVVASRTTIEVAAQRKGRAHKAGLHKLATRQANAVATAPAPIPAPSNYNA